jgi:hypothetical protein
MPGSVLPHWLAISSGPVNLAVAPAPSRLAYVDPTSWLLAGGIYSTLTIYDDLVDAVVALVRTAMVPGVLTWFGTGTSPGFGTAPLPYGVLHEPDEDDDDLNTSGDRTAEGHLEIHCYAPTKKAARKLGDAIEASLKDAPLEFTAGWLVYLRQSGRTAELDPDPAPGGGDCWDELRMFHFRYSYS